MEKFLDELILSERKKRKEKVLDKQIDLERDLPEQYLQTVVMSDKATSIKIPAFMKDLPEKLVEQKYEFEPIPQIIKSTQNGNINFTFSLLDVSVEPGQLAAYNESGCLIEAIERFKERTGYYQERVLADQIYWTRENRSYCKEQGIRLSGPKLGRPNATAQAEKNKSTRIISIESKWSALLV